MDSLRHVTPAEWKSLIAGGLGWMLDAMDVMLYSLILAYLIRQFGMSTSTAGLLNSLTLVASAIGGSSPSFAFFSASGWAASGPPRQP